MLNTTITRIVAVAAFVIGAVGLAAPAQANVVNRSCTTDGHILNGKVNYTLTTTQHIWNTVYGVVEGDDTGDQNDFHPRLYQNGTLVWAWDSADSYSKGEQWSKSMGGIVTPRSANEDLKLRAVFDEPGFDDECTAVWDY